MYYVYIYSTRKAVKDEQTALGGETAVFNLELCKKSDLRIKINKKNTLLRLDPSYL